MSDEPYSLFGNPPVGFRLMPADPLAVVICAVATVVAWEWLGIWALVAPYVLGHFFLFCNVFRVRRSYELVWAATFLLQAAVWLVVSPSLWGIALTQLPVTVVVIALEIRSPDYRGILARRRVE